MGPDEKCTTQEPAPTKTYSIREAAKAWGFPVSSLYEEVKEGRLHARVRAGRKQGLRVTHEEMERWLSTETEDAAERASA